MERNQFTFYRSYRDALRALNAKDFKAVVLAICDYALDESEPCLSGVPCAVFTLIRPTLDSGRNKAANRQNKTKTKEEQSGNKSEQTSKEKEGEKEREKENDSSLSISSHERFPRLTRLPNMPSCAERLLTLNHFTSSTPLPGGGIPRASRSTTGSRNSSSGKSASWRKKGAR